ncbi:MAG: hypothetical protein AAGF12_21745 [Myxococcota bacterium]
MAEDLGARLLRAGLVTRELLAQAQATAPPHGGALATALVDLGIEEDAIAGFFLAHGYGPLLDKAEIEASDPHARQRLDGSMAAGLLAYPVRSSPAGLVVAMVDPSDRHSVQEIRYAVGSDVLPTVARVSDLQRAIRDAWPRSLEKPPPNGPHERSGELEVFSDTPGELPIELVRKRPVESKSRVRVEDHQSAAGYQSSTKKQARSNAKASHRPPPPEPEEAPAPIRPPVHRTFTRPAETEPKVRMGDPEDRWGTILPGTGERAKLLPEQKIELKSAYDPAVRTGLLGEQLRALRGSKSRDEVVKTGCEAALTVGSSALFLALHRNTLKGRGAAGSGLSSDAVRNLWIPKRSPSNFRKVLETREPYRGAHGPTAADQIFRAAIGSRGGELHLHPILVGSKLVGVLAVAEPAPGPTGEDRIETIAGEMGDALERLILAKKTRR